MTFDQAEFEIRCEWGRKGLETLAPVSDVVIVVDVLSFSTAVDVALGRGGVILPFPAKGDSAAHYAALNGADLASTAWDSGFSLSPTSLQAIRNGLRLVLPSPNGAALCYSASHTTVLTACLRNAAATAEAAMRVGRTFAVIPAGETWEDGTLRPAVEDLAGAGAVIHALRGRRSPEACAAAAAFEALRPEFLEMLRTCSSGKELIERGFGADVDLAGELDVSFHVAQMVGREIRRLP